jgi:hypothetical protein
MTDHIPPWFADRQKEADDNKDFKQRRAALLEELPRLLERQKDRNRANQFLPYLLVRSVLGDRGDRPINVPFWESPDIWTAPGDPSVTPDVPSDHGGTVTAGQATTVYAHVWNLGFAPLAGIKVEFFWFDPSLSIDGTHAQLIGVARCELAGRGMHGSHKLVKCPTAWVPRMENGGHECLVVRASGIGDPLGGNDWNPWLNRHVGQRNISVVTAGANISHLIASLNASRILGGKLELIQVGGLQGELARKIAAPGLRIGHLETQMLGAIDVAGRITRSAATTATAAMMAPIHALAAGGAPEPPAFHGKTPHAIIDTGALFTEVRIAHHVKGVARRIATAERSTPKGSHLADLLHGARAFHPDRQILQPPARGEAQIVRVAQFHGDQLVGGYTMVVAGQQQ